MQTQYDKLKAILREMFQMDQADLDFGIYRIMNAKRGEIEKFLDKDLLPQVKEEFAKLQAGQDQEVLANEVFSHLASFFRRYYDNGDFMSLRRYKKDTYAIPYEGEEVKLHWANADQYYIKTSEYLKDYSFKLTGSKRVHFKLVDASQEKDNIKTEAGKERKFRLHETEPVLIDGDDLIVQFVYLPDKEKQDKHNQKTLETVQHEFKVRLAELRDFFDLIKEGLAKTEKDTKRSLLEKHLAAYTARFNYDFFIHKDLGGFLNRELDFYLKNEVIFIDDLDAQDESKLKSVVTKAKVLKHVARKVIAFLAQLENFQKKLWLKKKFVVSCDYCVTLDRVPEALYSEIVANDAQRKEWVRLFAIDQIETSTTGPGYSDPLSIGFLKANLFLLLDTKFFDSSFKEKLLDGFENLDANCNGVIINSENFQAINLLMQKYRERVRCIYIDPPYNTAASEIVYKNELKNSSWLSLIENRLSLAKLLGNKQATFCIAIDDFEKANLELLLDNLLGADHKLSCVIVRTNPHGRAMASGFSTNHEYALFYSIGSEYEVGRLPRNEERSARYSEVDIKGPFTWMNLRKTGADSARVDRPRQHYVVYVSTEGKVRVPVCVWDEDQSIYKDVEALKPGEIAVSPIDDAGNERSWSLGVERARAEASTEFMAKLDSGKWQVYRKYRPHEEGALPGTWWDDAKYSATESGTRTLKQLFQGRELFSYPKSVFLVEDNLRVLGLDKSGIVFDYFAGSGTTAHAVINLNRDDNGERKYILVEMGEYFDTVLKPRIQKVIYSKDWKDGKPVSRKGISHMFKYLRLEGYDDTLDNLVVNRSGYQDQTLEDMAKEAKEQYMLSYLLDIETSGSRSLLNINEFSNPFNYSLKIRKGSELQDQKVDLVETFNYLIGLYVDQVKSINGFKVIQGKLRSGEKSLVIWRNTVEKSNEDLDTFFKAQGYGKKDFALVFVNGDHTLENLKAADEQWSARLIEEEFKRRMFEEAVV